MYLGTQNWSVKTLPKKKFIGVRIRGIRETEIFFLNATNRGEYTVAFRDLHQTDFSLVQHKLVGVAATSNLPS